jgi:hypothetical protein
MEENIVKVKIRKQWYIKNGETKVGFTPVLETVGHSILLKTINKRDFYVLQDLMKDGTIPVIEINTKETAKNLDN